jgi:hypothetical protein
VTAVTDAAAHASLHPRDDAAQRVLPRPLIVAVTLTSALVFYALATHGSFNPLYEQPQAGFAGRFFFAQAHSLVHGHLDIAPTELPYECFVYGGRCYGYQGLTPSLLRVPFLPLLDDVNRSFTPLYLSVALTLAVGAALGIASRTLMHVPRTPLTTFLAIALAVSLGPASVLVMVTRPAVYEEAIAWSVAFALLGIYCFLRWWSTPRRSWALLLVLSLVLSTNARPTTLPLGVALGAGIVVRAWLGRREPGRARQAVLFGTVVAILPIVTCLGVWWLKFNDPFPSLLLNAQIGGASPAPWWLAIRRVDHDSLAGVRFVPTALVAYLRPDGIALTSAFPFIDFRSGPAALPHFLGIPRGSLYVEPFSTVTDTMPLAVATVIAGLLYARHQARRRAAGLLRSLAGAPMTYCILGTAASCGVMMSNAFITNRYLADWFPLIAVALPVAAGLLARPAAQLSRRGAVALAGGVTLLVASSLLVNLALDYRYWWHTAI